MSNRPKVRGGELLGIGALIARQGVTSNIYEALLLIKHIKHIKHIKYIFIITCRVDSEVFGLSRNIVSVLEGALDRYHPKIPLLIVL